MNKNSSTVTIPQAMKIYQGSSMLKGMVLLMILPTAILLGAMVWVLIIGLMEQGGNFSATVKKLCDSSVANFIFGMILAPTLATEIMLTHDRELPGGKFVRTVKGGFSTFAKFRTGMLICMIVQSAGYLALVALINVTGLLPFKWGMASVAATAISALLTIGLCSFILVIRNYLTRSLLMMITAFALVAIGPLSLFVTDGKLTIIHLAAAAAAVILTIVSHKFVLAYYKKNRWLESR